MVDSRVTVGSITPTPFASETLVPLRVTDLLAGDPPSQPPLGPEAETPVLLPRRTPTSRPAVAHAPSAVDLRLQALETSLFRARVATAAALTLAAALGVVGFGLATVTLLLVV